MVCEVNKVDSNLSATSFAEEICPRKLPVLATDGRDPEWDTVEVNSFSDFGADYVRTARQPIDPGRQKKRGNISDLTAGAGFNADFTQRNSKRFFQALYFANAYEAADTSPLNPAITPKIIVTAVDGAADAFNAASGLTRFTVGDLVRSSGFTIAANNVLTTVLTSVTGALGVAADLVAEASPPSAARLQTVGRQFASADVALVVANGVATLTSAASAFPVNWLQPGEWVFVGGDATSTQYTTGGNKPFYGRCKSLTTGILVLDKVTATLVTDPGTGKTIRIFKGTHTRNEKAPAKQVARTFAFNRTLGSDASGPQSEQVYGAFANQIVMNSPIPGTDAKVNIDWTFLGMSASTLDGTQSALPGVVNASLGEAAINTAQNIYRLKLAIIDPATLNPSALFGYVSDFTLTISNNASVNKAQGVLGGFSISVGDFQVGGDINAYFTTVAAIAAIKANAELTFDVIYALGNGAVVFDIPTLGLAGGKPNVAKDKPVMLPVTNGAYESPFGTTASTTFFEYVPTVAMPS